MADPGITLRHRVLEQCEGQICYLRCSGTQRLNGALVLNAGSGVAALCFNGTTNCLNEATGILTWTGNNGFAATVLRGSGSTAFSATFAGLIYLYGSDA